MCFFLVTCSLQNIFGFCRDCVLTAQVIEATLVSITVELVEECVCEGVRGVAGETLQQLKQEKNNILEALKQKCLLLRTQKYWHR